MTAITIGKSGAVALCAIAAFAAVPASAATFFTNTTGLAAPTTTLAFNEVAIAPGTAVTNQYASYGVTFNNLWLDNSYTYTPTPGLASFQNGCPCFDAEIAFSSPVSGAAFRLVTNEGNSTIEAYLGAALVSSVSVPTGYGAEFFGFTGGGFDRIRVSAPVNQAMLIDDLQIDGNLVTAVPEPSTWAMLILGFGLVGGALRSARRKRLAVTYA